ncbi:hypothetical protein LIER_04646 [Lithospermum erythrorhizon]|uniref:Uncharacterized protein n=1 Tax=Lithospermum erythrorhizon TaxID=34254 RepID=A0AAV3NXG8_LITER
MGLGGHEFLKNKALNKCTNDVKALKDLMTTNDKLDAELTLHLLTAPEKVSEMEYSIATILLATDFRKLASKTDMQSMMAIGEEGRDWGQWG